MRFFEITLELLGGFGLSCLLFLLTLVLAIPMGLVLSFCTMSNFKPVRTCSRVLVWVIRGIPLMLFVLMIFYLPGILDLGSNIFAAIDKASRFTDTNGTIHNGYMGSFIAVLIAFAVNYACYFSEIFRGGIESISAGQYEAGQVLGMTKFQVFRKVILKQVIKRILPPMSNEIITLIKDTALANVISIPEIIMLSNRMASKEAIIWPIFYTAVFYLLFVGGLTLLFSWAEKKLSYFKA